MISNISLSSIASSISRTIRQFSSPFSHLFDSLNLENTRAHLMLWKWTKMVGLGLVGSIATAAVVGALYQAINVRLDMKKYPPIGEMVDIGGYRMHIHRTGHGDGPTIVLNAGLGLNSLDWSLVQPEIAKFAQVVSFDRPGNGWSDESPLERTSVNNVEELRLGLKNANIPGPYILVAHSGAGIDARLFASKYPDEVAGIVLVDSSHEDQSKVIPPPPKANRSAALLFTHLGLTRLQTHSDMYKKSLEMFPEDIQQMTIAHVSSAKFIRTVLEESASFDTCCAQLKEAGGNLGDKPLIVISAGKAMESAGTGYTQEQINQIVVDFKSLQKDLVTKSKRGEQMIAEESDHMIPRHQPAIIVTAVQKVMTSIN